MPLINFQSTEEQKEFLDKQSNYSEYIRSLIDKDRGKGELSLTETESIIREKEKELIDLKERQNTYINKLLAHKEELTGIQIKELEEKKLKDIQEEQEFIAIYKPQLENIEEIRNFQFIEGWGNIENLMPILDILRKQNIRIGLSQLRRFLALQNEVRSRVVETISD